MRKTLLFLFSLLMLPVVALAQTNQAVSQSSASYSASSVSQTRVVVPLTAAGLPQEAATAGQNFSLGMWFNTTSVYTGQNPQRAIIVRMGTKTHMNQNGAFWVHQDSSGALTFCIGGDNIGGQSSDSGTTYGWNSTSKTGGVSLGTATLGEWHYLLLSFDADNTTFTAYLDGEQAYQDTGAPGFGYKWGDGDFQIVPQSFNGSLDEVQLYNKALSADEAAAAYVNARVVDGLASLFTFDEVKEGTTGQFASQVGSVADAVATFKTGVYGNWWAEGLVNLSTDTETAPTLVEGRTLAAYDVNVTIMDGEGGSLSITDGTNTWTADDETFVTKSDAALTITATPDEGYQLIGIYAVDVNTMAQTEITGENYLPTGDVIITARYTSDSYALTVVNEHNIDYTLTLGGKEVTDLSALMGGGAEYKLTLTVADDKVLNAVRLDDEELEAVNGVYSIFMDKDATLTIDARAKANYTVTFATTEGGSVSATYQKTVGTGVTTVDVANGASLLEGTVLTLSNTPEAGHQFVKYTVNGRDLNGVTVTLSENVTISGVFEEGIDYCEPVYGGTGTNRTTTSAGRYLTRISVSDGTNSVDVAGGGSSSGRAVYYDRTSTIFATEAGKTITVTTVGGGSWMNHFGYVDFNRDGFDSGDKVYNNYTGNGNNVDGCTFTFTVPENIAAGQYRVRHMLDWDNTDPCKFAQGQSGDNGECVVDFMINVAAVELESPRTVSVVAANEAQGSVAITDPATEDSSISTKQKTVTVEATPAEGFAFMNWTSGEEVVSTDATYTYAGETDIELTANFGHTVSYTVGSEGSAVFTIDGAGVSNGQVVAAGSELTITVNPPTGKVAQVNVDNAVVALENNTYTAQINANTTIAVVFVDALYNLNIVIEGQGTAELWTGGKKTEAPSGDKYEDGAQLPSGGASLKAYIKAAEGWKVESATWDRGDGNPAARTLSDVTAEGYEGYKFASLPKTAGNAVLSVVFVEDSTSAIDGIGIDPANGPVEYFNLQGVKVSGENLAPGFYIVRQGDKTAKILVK